MNVRLHAGTIEHIRTMLQAERAALPIASADVSVRGAAVISHDVITAIDVMLARLLVPTCSACESMAAKEGEAA